MSAALKILVIRRDNIGDLVCTTPVFSGLRKHYPTALVCVLVNHYNAPVLIRHPHVDRVFVYTKLKHRAAGQSRLRLLVQRVRMYRELKKAAFDYVLLPNDQPRLLRLARGIRPQHIIALGSTDAEYENITLLPAIREGREHEAQATYRLLEPLGIRGTPPPGLVVADPIAAAKARNALDMKVTNGTVIGIHISARKPSQRWATGRFSALIHALHARHSARFILLWAPGTETNSLHPGDDRKAQAIVQATEGLPVLPYATHALAELIGALSVCDTVICCDGGAMHLAAALCKPIVCLFGRSDAVRWHPWDVPHSLLQAASKDVTDITVDDVIAAYEQLALQAPPPKNVSP